MDNVSIANLIRIRQDKFIETRTIIEAEVDKFLASIGKMDPDVQKKCGYIPDANAKSLLPELWNEPFREEVYKQQLNGVLTYIAQVQKVCDEINKEAVECLQS